MRGWSSASRSHPQELTWQPLSDNLGRKPTHQDLESNAPNLQLLTECSMGDYIMAESPDGEMIGICSVRCPQMDEVTLEHALVSLHESRHVIDVPHRISSRAAGSIGRMMAL